MAILPPITELSGSETEPVPSAPTPKAKGKASAKPSTKAKAKASSAKATAKKRKETEEVEPERADTAEPAEREKETKAGFLTHGLTNFLRGLTNLKSYWWRYALLFRNVNSQQASIMQDFQMKSLVAGAEAETASGSKAWTWQCAQEAASSPCWRLFKLGSDSFTLFVGFCRCWCFLCHIPGRWCPGQQSLPVQEVELVGVEDGCEAGLFSPPLSIIAGSDHTTTRESCVNKMWPVRLGIGTTPGPRRERFAPGVQVVAFPVSSLCEPFSLFLSLSLPLSLRLFISSLGNPCMLPRKPFGTIWWKEERLRKERKWAYLVSH